MGIIKKVFGTKNDREIKKIQPLVIAINSLEKKYETMTDEELKNQTKIFRKEIAKGKKLDDLIIPAFAVVREAAKRTVKMRHYDVQMIGGVVMHQGKIAEMKTGEGKTLVATLSVYLNALPLYSKWIEAAKKTYGDDPENWIYEEFFILKEDPEDRETWTYVPRTEALERFGPDPDYWEEDSSVLSIGKGAHLVTVNDYLAKRDAEWMGLVYNFLGLTVGVVVHGLDDEERKAEYGCDITYGTNNEFGFDYLRDNMKYDIEDYVQRDLHYCIVDEVDSILIDEARTPLIISGPKESNIEKYAIVDKVVRKLKEVVHFTIDIKDKLSLLTEAGVEKCEKELGITNLYAPENIEYMHHVEQSLKAHFIFKEGVDYVVQGGKVIIVDEFTGRLMDGRSWSDGLHQAVEAKEAINTPLRVQRLLGKGEEVPEEDRVPPEVANENQTLATITFQNYFRMYEKLSGMTGTADTEAAEFAKIYKLDVVVIPTNKPIDRKDMEDLVYRSVDEKMNAVIEEIKRVHAGNQPILVGTISIESSEEISEALSAAGVKHNVLNAKNHKKEAFIVSQAGRFGAVTVATNMAGRGTDIKLGGNPESLTEDELLSLEINEESDGYEEKYQELLSKYEAQCIAEKKKVLQAGGLYILGTERHESRRIDNQLRGRSGRQGDPGASRFFISLQDDLMKRFGGDRIGGMMGKLGYQEGQPITHKMISKSIANAQKKVEAMHFDIRKNVIEYDDVMNLQRKTIYTLRKNLLDGLDLKERVFDILEEITLNIIDKAIGQNMARPDEWNMKYLTDKVKDLFGLEMDFEDIQDREKLEDMIYFDAEKLYKDKEEEIGAVNLRKIERYYYLQTLDNKWKDHLLTMDLLRESIGLRGYGQKDPKIEYKKEGYALFVKMLYEIKVDFVKKLVHTQLDDEDFDVEYDFADEMNMNMEMNWDELNPDPDAEKMAMLNNMNGGLNQLRGFDFSEEKAEYNALMNRMQLSGEYDTEEEEKPKKKEARKFKPKSKYEKKKLKKKGKKGKK